ncbi:TPA: hypothetical protein MDY81_001836 [Klebsiella aerogenes]|nr:hypothetical protein [Klebsiella aerogenes]HBV4567341.1 hypothetical protein [Klebsiella aerogenes]
MPAIRARLLGRDVLNETIIPVLQGPSRYNPYSFWLKLIKCEKIYICFHIWWLFVIFRVLFVFFAVLSASGCVQKTLDERIAEAKGKYVAQSGPGSSDLDHTQDVNPLVRLECSTKAGTKISALVNGTSQTVTVSGAVFRYVDRFDDSNGKDTLMFGRVNHGEKYALFIQMDSFPVPLTMYNEKMGVISFSCQPYTE